MKKALIICISVSAYLSVSSQQRLTAADSLRRDSIRKLTQADYQLMLSQLQISNTRPGPSGNPTAPNAANTDEAKATTYTSLPDPLKFKNGKKVTTIQQWLAARRKEIANDFDNEIYGVTPLTPSVTWKVIETITEKNTITKRLVGHVDNNSYPAINVNIQLQVTTPATITTPIPLIMEFGFIDTTKYNSFPWQQQLLAKGWGYAIIVPSSYQADNGAGLQQGIIGLVNKGQPRKVNDWGSLKAWAWGASRALDYLETDKAVDAKRIGIEGLSRYGKAAIVTMAYEPRFAIGFIGSSGAGGAKLLRRNLGEQIENLASSAEYHWFAGNFIKYAATKNANDLPVDAHELISLCAPRPVFISVGSPTVEGQWVDGKGSFLAAVYAGPVYRLLKKKDLGATELPPQETALITGELAFRQHAGGHTTGPNWPTFIEFASRYFDK